MDLTKEAAWHAAATHGRAGVRRLRQGSQAPTLAQLRMSKWDARQARTLAAILGRKEMTATVVPSVANASA